MIDRCDSPYSHDMPYLSEEIIHSLRNCLLHQSTPNVVQSAVHDPRCNPRHSKKEDAAHPRPLLIPSNSAYTRPRITRISSRFPWNTAMTYAAFSSFLYR